MASRVLEVAIVGNAKQLQSTIGKANAQVQGFGSKMEATGKRMQSVGKTLTTHLTLPIVGAGLAAGKMALDFETSMTHIQALTGASSKQTKQWGDQILAMGKTLPIAPQELAKALYFVASAGVKTSQVMPILRKSAEAAAAGMGDTETVAQLLTSAINAYGPKALSAGRATDVLTEAVKLGKAEPADLAANLGKVIPIASTMGVKFGEVAVSVAELTNTGLNAAEATTAVRATMVGLLKPSAGAADELDKLGFSVKEVQDSVAKKGLNATLDILAKRIGGNRQEMAKLFPNVRALNGFLSLTGKNAGNVKDALDKMAHSTGATDQAFKTAGHSAEFQMRLSLARLQDTAIKVGEVLIPIFERVVAKVMIGVTWFSKLSTKWQDVILVALGVAAAIGPVVGLIGTLIVVAKSMLFVTKLWTAAQWLLNAALDANPIGLAIIAAAALAAAFVILWKRSGTFRDIVRTSLHAVQTAFGLVVGFIQAHWKTMLTILTGGWSNVVQFIINHWSTIKAAANHVVGFIINRWGNIKSAISTFGHWVDKYVIGPIKTIIAWARKAISLLEALSLGSSNSTAGRTGTGGNSSSANIRLASSQMSRYGWGSDQMNSLIPLWNQESGWNANAVNPSSNAQGIPQLLPSAHPGAHPGFPSWPPVNPASQIGWGLGYIRGSYGSPAGAWAHEQKYNWYDKGGVVPGPRGVHRPIWAAGGETILPTHKNGGMPQVIVVPVMLERDLDTAVRKSLGNTIRTGNPVSIGGKTIR